VVDNEFLHFIQKLNITGILLGEINFFPLVLLYDEYRKEEKRFIFYYCYSSGLIHRPVFYLKHNDSEAGWKILCWAQLLGLTGYVTREGGGRIQYIVILIYRRDKYIDRINLLGS
jgi:hypothetical protein